MANHGTAPTAVAGMALQLVSVRKVYNPGGSAAVTALDGVDLGVAQESFTAVMGPSGSGKSTLLQCAAGLDEPTSGQVFLGGEPLPTGTETAVTTFRRERVGFVFQHFNLLPTLTVLQNVELPLRLAGRPVDRERSVDVLDRFGLGDRLRHRPAQLSGGQQQRAAIARALIADPAVIFADEPTGALDTHSAAVVLRALRSTVQEHRRTVVMVTHDPTAAAYADSVQFLADGRTAGTLANPTAEAVAERITHLTRQMTRRNKGEG